MSAPIAQYIGAHARAALRPETERLAAGEQPWARWTATAHDLLSLNVDRRIGDLRSPSEGSIRCDFFRANRIVPSTSAGVHRDARRSRLVRELRLEGQRRPARRRRAGTSGGGSGDDGGGDCTGFGCTASSGGRQRRYAAAASEAAAATATAGSRRSAPSVNGPVNDNSCPGVLSAANVTALKAAKSNSASLKWLYPYDATVFPGGLQPPVLQWSQSGTPDGVYLHLHSQKYDFTGCFKGSNPPQLQIPAIEWATAFAQSGGKPDPLTVQLSTISGQHRERRDQGDVDLRQGQPRGRRLLQHVRLEARPGTGRARTAPS